MPRHSVDENPHTFFGENDPAEQAESLPNTHTVESIQAWMVLRLSAALGVEPDDIDVRLPLTSYGLDSLAAFTLTGDLADWLGRELPATLFWDYPTLEALAQYVAEQCNGSESADVLNDTTKYRSSGSEEPTHACAERTILRRANRDSAALSFAQQRLWFLDKFEPDNPFYNITQAVRMNGTLQLEALRETLDTIIARHQALRTTIDSVDGHPVQVIAENRSAELTIIDLSTRSDADREGEAQRLLTREAQRPFNLSHDVMLRAMLLRLDRQEHILLLAMHHVASDGWSIGVLFREFAILYDAFSAGKPSPLPPLPIQYADYALWQRRWLQGEVLEAQLAYWRKQLHGSPVVLDLPTDRLRPAVQSFRGARQSLALTKSCSEALKALSRKEGVTLFMTLLAAFKTLLLRYTGQEDIVVGSAIAGRNRVELEGLIGFFVNTLALRTNLSGNPSFRQLLGRVREVTLGAYNHQDLPFEKLVEELDPPRNLSHSPLFQVMFVFQNARRQVLELSGLTLSPLTVDNGTAKFDLTLTMDEGPDGLQGSLEYNTDLFESGTIERMRGHFQILLEGLVADPDRPILDLPLLTKAERNQILFEWNETRADYSHEGYIPQLFEAQVERTPDKVATILEDRQLTYRELNRQGNQLAHYLRAQGVGAETLVGVFMERSLEMVVGILGVLKAGGVHVPLDPAYPKERLKFMMGDAQVSVLLTQEHLKAPIAESAVQVVCLDTGWEVVAGHSQANLTSGVTAENLAYVIYTSGSSGRPKGVAISYGAITNHCRAVQQHYHLDANDRVLQFASLSFDVSLEQILPPLISGATLVLRGKDLWKVSEFKEKVLHFGVTVANLPPAYWHEVVQEWDISADLVSNHPLRLVIIGGDAMSPESIQLCQQTPLRLFRLLNAYGPTETTITATAFAVPGQWSDERSFRRVPIGRPLGNRTAYILCQHGQPVPIGVAGELHIGGAGLARGYLNCPELTAEKFIPNPFADKPGERLYQTGDLARYLPDGNIEFLGRSDHQVKIRGFRIELDEIEATLAQHGEIGQCVVTTYEHGGDRRLVAYLTVQGHARPSVADLRRHLSAKLPEYMVPSAFVFLEALPLTPNGKINRSALPAPDPRRPECGSVAPRNDVERQLVKVWQDVLEVESLSITDNFFDLGGHSLLAVRLFVEIEKSFRRSLPVASIFSAPTVEQLAAKLGAPQASASVGCIVVLQEKGDRPPLFCMSRGALFDFRRLALHLGDDQPVYGLQYPGSDGQQEPLTSVEEIATEFIRHIRMVQPEGPYYLCGLCFGGLVAYEIAQQLVRQNRSVALLALLDTFVIGFEGPKRTRRHRWDDNESSRLVGWIHRVRAINKEAGRHYRPQPYPGRLTLLRPAKRSWDADQLNGWGSLVRGGIETYSVKGHHHQMFKERKIRSLAKQMRACLLAAQAQSQQIPTLDNELCSGVPAQALGKSS